VKLDRMMNISRAHALRTDNKDIMLKIQFNTIVVCMHI